MINDAPAMKWTAVHACKYVPKEDGDPSLTARTSEELIGLYGSRVTGKIQRLRVILIAGSLSPSRRE
jgi:hypothetical protein